MTLRRIRARALIAASALCSLLLCVLAIAPGSGGVAARPAPSDPPPEDGENPRGMELLRRAADAGDSVAYKGVQFVSSWSGERSDSDMVNVAHVPGEGTSYQTVPTSATPSDQTMVVDDTAVSGLGLDDRLLSLLDRNYRVVRVGEDEVCGRTATKVAARRGDGSVAARFWVDTGKGVLLRRETLDSEGRITQASAFVSISFGTDTIAVQDEEEHAKPRGEPLSDQDIERLRGDGWHIPASLPPNLTLVEVRSTGGEQGRVLHLSYSEGLSVVSVFVQRGRLGGDTEETTGLREVERGGRVFYVSDTVQYRRMWESDDHVYTVVADAPSEIVETAVSALPKADKTGFWHRIGRGFDRLGSWVGLGAH